MRRKTIISVKSMVAVLLLMLFSSANSFSGPALPFTDNFTGKTIGSDWIEHDADKSNETSRKTKYKADDD